MRVQMTEVYRDWINSLKTGPVVLAYRSGSIGSRTETPDSTGHSPMAFVN